MGLTNVPVNVKAAGGGWARGPRRAAGAWAGPGVAGRRVQRPGGLRGDGGHRRKLARLASVSEELKDAAPALDGEAGHPELAEVRARIDKGGAARYHEAAAAQGKLFARDRIALLVDEGSFTEDGAFANVLAEGLPADGVITGTATVGQRLVALMANDSTVKAGSWGARTVEKIIRIIEKAYTSAIPMIYLVDSAGAPITAQVEVFPGHPGTRDILRTQAPTSAS